MKNKIIPALLLLGLFVNACSANVETSNPEAVAASTKPAATEKALATSMPGVTETADPAREAVLSEVEKTVLASPKSNIKLSPAKQGMSIYLGGVVETGIDGKVRLDLLPEGTIVRVGPNSSFALPELTLDENGEPKTTIELFFGKIFVLLNGGSLNVSTPSGVATVQGSLLSVGFDPETGILTAGCLEGHCTIAGEDGEEIDIPEGEESSVEEGETPSDPDPLDQEDVEEWLEEFSESELEEFLDEVPDPEDYPEEEVTPEPTEEPVATGEASATQDPEATEEPEEPAATEEPSASG